MWSISFTPCDPCDHMMLLLTMLSIILSSFIVSLNYSGCFILSWSKLITKVDAAFLFMFMGIICLSNLLVNFNPPRHLSQQDPTMEICKNIFLKVLMLVKLKCLVFHVLSSHFTQIQGHHLCINIAKLCNIMFHCSPLAFEVLGKAISSPTRAIVIVMARNPLLKCSILKHYSNNGTFWHALKIYRIYVSSSCT